MMLFPFRLEAERVVASRTIDAQNAIEMVDFVLEELRKTAQCFCLVRPAR